jgi:hypothetical protein
MTFSARPVEHLEHRQNFTFQVLTITFINVLQLLHQDTKQIEVCDCQIR